MKKNASLFIIAAFLVLIGIFGCDQGLTGVPDGNEFGEAESPEGRWRPPSGCTEIYHIWSTRDLALHYPYTSSAVVAEDYPDKPLDAKVFAATDFVFKLIDQGNGYFRIQHVESGKYLYSLGAVVLASTNILPFLETAHDFKFEYTGGTGRYNIRNRFCGAYVCSLERLENGENFLCFPYDKRYPERYEFQLSGWRPPRD